MSIISVTAVLIFAGVCAASPGTRIINGSPTTIESYPSAVQIDFFNPDSVTWSQSCVGTILNQIYVLTAAQCIDDRSHPFNINNFSVQNRRVRAGATYRNLGGVVAGVSSVVTHPDYNVITFLDANIGLITLASVLTFGNSINSIPIIPHNFVIPNNAPVTHAGWGATGDDADEQSSNQLLFINLVHRQSCEGVPPVMLTDYKICTASPTNLPGGACGGDAGAPMIYGGILGGVTSWGPSTCESQIPTLSAKVAAFTDWILQNTS